MFDLVSRVFSPYQLNPFNVNPLRSVLKPLVDFDALRKRDRRSACSCPRPTCAPAGRGCFASTS